jgi:hypothetical protein
MVRRTKKFYTIWKGAADEFSSWFHGFCISPFVDPFSFSISPKIFFFDCPHSTIWVRFKISLDSGKSVPRATREKKH